VKRYSSKKVANAKGKSRTAAPAIRGTQGGLIHITCQNKKHKYGGNLRRANSLLLGEGMEVDTGNYIFSAFLPNFEILAFFFPGIF